MPIAITLRSLAATAALALGLAPAVLAGEAPRHIFYVMMENHAYGEIIGNTDDAPYINALAAHAGQATQYFGVTHPSLPNYLAAMSGDFQGLWDDCKAGVTILCAPEEFVADSGDATASASLTAQQIANASSTPHWFAGLNIVDQLEPAGLSWRAYFQSMPEGGYDVEYAPVVNNTVVKLYAQKHNPFLYFSDIRNSAGRLANIVPFEQHFAQDLKSHHVPNFVFIAPDQCHDMHGMSPSSAALVGFPACGYPASGLDHGAIQLGDQFLRDTVEAIRHSWTWRHESSAIVIVWDEDDYAGYAGCCGSPTGQDGVLLGGAQVPMMVLRSGHEHARAHGVSKPANHYSLLATIQHLWNLDCLGQTCPLREKQLLTRLFED